MNILDAGLEGILSVFIDKAELGGAADSLETLQRGLSKLMGWAIANPVKFNKS